MTLSAGRYFRLTASIRSTLESLEVKGDAVRALSDAYITFRAEGRLVAEERGVVDEFERMFPELAEPAPVGGPSARGVIRAASDAHGAAGLLLRLAGWLDGFAEEARLELEAKAYAEARITHEPRQ